MLERPRGIHARGHGHLVHGPGQDLDHAQEGPCVGAWRAGQALHHQRVTGVLLVASQVAPGPPHHGVPPEGDASGPFDPTHEVVTALEVRQFVAHDPTQLISIHLLQQRRRQHQLDASARPPGHG